MQSLYLCLLLKAENTHQCCKRFEVFRIRDNNLTKVPNYLMIQLIL